MGRNAAFASMVALLVALSMPVPGARAQDAPKDAGLSARAPAGTVFLIERQGRAHIDDAVRASNFGEYVKDDAIRQMVDDTRDQIGTMIAQGPLGAETEEEVAEYRKHLRDLLTPFWFNNGMMFGMMPEGADVPPKGLYVVGGKYDASAKAALAELVKIGVPDDGAAGPRQSFTCKVGDAVWHGVAKHHGSWALDPDPAELRGQIEDKDVFMYSTSYDVIAIAEGPDVADAIDKALSGDAEERPFDKSLAAVMDRTRMDDWAFRWFVDVEGLRKWYERAEGEIPDPFAQLGLLKVRGVGGTEGYVDNVVTRLDFVDAPGGESFELFAKGGSYAKGLAMAPSEATFRFGAHLDTKAALGLMATSMGFPAGGPPADADEDAQAVYRELKALMDLSEGHVGLCITNVQGMMAAGMGGPPIGAAFDVSDEAKALAAVKKLAALAPDPRRGGGFYGPPMEGEASEDGAGPETYRKVEIHRFAGFMQFAVVENRVVFGMSDSATRAFIDAALDDLGGVVEGSDTEKMFQLAGDGQFAFAMDMKSLVQLGWPFLIQASSSPYGSPLPLRSLPSVGKMARLAGPEVAVARRVEGGLLIDSRGKLPFAMKVASIGGASAVGMMFYMVARYAR